MALAGIQKDSHTRIHDASQHIKSEAGGYQLDIYRYLHRGCRRRLLCHSSTSATRLTQTVSYRRPRPDLLKSCAGTTSIRCIGTGYHAAARHTTKSKNQLRSSHFQRRAARPDDCSCLLDGGPRQGFIEGLFSLASQAPQLHCSRYNNRQDG